MTHSAESTHAVEGRCGRCGRVTDYLPCPLCAADRVAELEAALRDADAHWRLGSDQDWVEYHDAKTRLRKALTPDA